jgi:NAD-dependent deacetylase
MTVEEHLQTIADWIAGAGSVAVLTGAGVSTASGVPDFRGPKGLWTRDPKAERLANIDVYVSDPEVRCEAWRRRLESADRAVTPNPAHHALVALERLGRLDRLVTQNVDGLHQDAGSDPDRVVEIHGTVREATCLDCSWRGPMRPVLDRVRAGEADPACAECGGMLKSATVSFGQALDPDELQRAHEAAVGCDVFLAIGSSLVVYPIAMLPQVALEAGARLAVLNGEPTPYDDRAHAVLAGDVSSTLPRIAELVRRGV